jgi:branched-chain amino acid transport system ATP-binding protein
VILLNELTVSFHGFKAVDGLSADLGAPVVGLIGPNGAGKTTLVNALCGFVPSSGGFALGADRLDHLTPMARVRQGLRRSFQTEQVVEDLSAWDNVLSLLDHLPARPTADTEAEVARALDHVGLLPVATRWGSALNLFERRMLELAKTLVGQPRLILLDEPGAGLTEQESQRLRDAILAIHADFGAQVLLIDHDVDLISAVCTETLVMDFGRCLAVGETRAVLSDPQVRRAYLGT